MNTRHPEFPLQSDLIYLNHAAVSPWPKRTSEAVSRFAEENIVAGAAHYPKWLTVETCLKAQLRALLNAPSIDDIALVKNTSEAISMVAAGLDWYDGDNIVSTDEEFPSNRIPWQSLAHKGVELRVAPLANTEQPEDSLIALLDGKTRLLAVSSVQYGSGVRLDLERLGEACRRQGVLFLVDAIQSLGALRFDVQACQADIVMADGHKWMLGPEGLGVFFTSARARELIHPSQFGWRMVENAGDYDAQTWEIAHSARRYECGSPNMLGIHALSASLSLLLEVGIEQVEQAILRRTAFLKNLIQRSRNLQLTSPVDRLGQSGIVRFRHSRIANDKVHVSLRENKVVCALRTGGIRFSPHFYTPEDQLAEAVKIADAA